MCQGVRGVVSEFGHRSSATGTRPGGLERLEGSLEISRITRYGVHRAVRPIRGYGTAAGLQGQPLKEIPTSVACPQCGNPMRVRKSRYGEFYGCSTYP